jgi:hypothetical protein
VDELLAQAAHWCEAIARELTTQDLRQEERLAAVLGAIGEGLRLRRELDRHRAGNEPVAAARRDVMRRLVELEVAASERLADLGPGAPLYRECSARLKEWLAEARRALRTVVTAVHPDPLEEAIFLQGLRSDLEWFSRVLAQLDQEKPPPLIALVDVELERLRGTLVGPTDHHPDPRDEALRVECEQLQTIVLGRRLRCELARSLEVPSAESLWMQRFHLSRIQAQYTALNHAAPSSRSHLATLHAAVDWLEAVKCRRAELAAAVDNLIAKLPLAERALHCERIVQSFFDEVGETIAFLEDMSLKRAVKTLELVLDDLERIIASFRLWNRCGPDSPPPSGAPAPDHDGEGRPYLGGAVSTAATHKGALAGQHGTRFEVSDMEGSQEGAQRKDDDAVAVRRQARRAKRLLRQVRGEWQEKVLALRMESIFGSRPVAILENTVLILIVVLFALIGAEAVLRRLSPGGLSVAAHVFFAWADLAICSVFLFEFALKLSLAPNRLSYFLRHLAIDFIASLPFGFIAHQIDLEQMESVARTGPQLGLLPRLAQFGRLARVMRFLRAALPIFRLARLGLVLLRLSDRLVRRMASVLNRNIVFFEPLRAPKPESSERHRLRSLRSELEHARSTIAAQLDRQEQRQLAQLVLHDLYCRVESIGARDIAGATEEFEGREIPIEAVVERLIQMTPERLLDRMGPAFVAAADRYIRLLNLPLLRRLPIVRQLVAYHEKSPAEAVALAANYLGHLIQRGLDVIYFFADLHGTLSPPVFLDRLGATIVNATRTPAKRLLWLGSAFLVLFMIVRWVVFLHPFRGIVDRMQTLMGWPVIILGAVCLVFWLLGAWFRRIANQSADFCERLVEAQFAAHTKSLKSRRRDQDAQFISKRVIDPEFLLRSSDDQPPSIDQVGADAKRPTNAPNPFENRELAFLRNVRLLYQDYLDGSPLHRSDTKASVQLLGNLAVSNLRRSHLDHLLHESRTLDRLDLSRAGGLLGGPYLWFNYITRMLVQETAILILDYNRHAVPLDRLACSPESVRRVFRQWLARRLRIEPEDVWLPEPVGRPSSAADGQTETADARSCAGAAAIASVQGWSTRREAAAFLETVEFTAVDFLADDPQREAQIRARFGAQVAELVQLDRQQNVRRAFRSFPLHELPLAARTINPFALYETRLAGGRIVLLPLILAGVLARGAVLAVRSIYRVVHAILHPQVDRQLVVPPDTYWAALRKIHRMRKPVFMGSLWLRARFDVEYLGLALPSAPPGLASQSLMEGDLDYIGATRRDRIIAEQFRRRHRQRLEWVARWLLQFGWTFDELPAYLSREIPFLVNRGGEALRALVAACVLDHDDIATLALSIEGLKRTMAHAADPASDPNKLPTGLPDPVVNLRTLWHPVFGCKRPQADLFGLPCFGAFDPAQRRRIERYLHLHHRVVRGWIKVVLGQGGSDPWANVKGRMRDVLLRTDLWSDQILVLRAVQTLTMLDLQHNSELVWSLGGYVRPDSVATETTATLAGTPLLRADEPVAFSS